MGLIWFPRVSRPVFPAVCMMRGGIPSWNVVKAFYVIKSSKSIKYLPRKLLLFRFSLTLQLRLLNDQNEDILLVSHDI
jgi:hypothetical protein